MAQLWSAEYEADLARLPPELRSPVVAGPQWREASTYVLERLGEICVARGNYPLARLWFERAYQADVGLLDELIAAASSWPTVDVNIRTRQKVDLSHKLMRVAYLGRMASRSPGQGGIAQKIAPWLDWQTEYIGRELDEYLSERPTKTAVQISGAQSKVVTSLFIPALVFGHAAARDAAVRMMEEVSTWFARVGSDEYLIKGKAFPVAQLRIAQALAAGDAPEFYRWLEVFASWFVFRGDDKFRADCFVEAMAVFLQGAELLGNELLYHGRCVPKGLKVAVYWGAADGA